MIKRIFVEKKPGFDVEAQAMLRDFRDNLGLTGLQRVRVFVRYDVEGLADDQYVRAKTTIFSEPQVDVFYDEALPSDTPETRFTVEYLPGQYDQRADFAEQCLQMLTMGERPTVRTGRVIALEGEISPSQFEEIKNYTINSVDSWEVPEEKPKTLERVSETPGETPVIEGFIKMGQDQLNKVIDELGLAMDLADIEFCRDYFLEEGRDPTLTEVRVLDTYWSDHCRHTTFLTHLKNIEIEDERIREVYNDYLANRNKDKPVCLMDLATAAMRRLKAAGKLQELDESEEINACSIEIPVDVNGVIEPWLVMFKNETHNHPTEIEPFGGAATCLGGAIRDPLSGRAYLYQAMRVTGSGDPRAKVSDTIKGKLPQRKISTTAAAGYSSYGNQIGLATGLVSEIYDQGYIAKRMEVGAVIGAVPKDNVVREVPSPGDVVILLGGRTGRDGCGGATGSSKAHDHDSLTQCGAEVQKGNPPEERKIERLFRKKDVSTLIKRCNDFGAGGVSVAIGELADGLLINLDAVPKKYDGLSGTELAISESQERMAVVVSAVDADKFIALSSDENLEATPVAQVTEEKRLIMTWRGAEIVNLSREFINSNGAPKSASAKVTKPDLKGYFDCTDGRKATKEAILSHMSDLNICSQKGLVERFDSTIGARSVLLPFGGRRQLTPAQCMAARVPVADGAVTDTATLMSYGYNPTLSRLSPFHGAVYAVLDSATKIVAAGGDLSKIYFTFQEYFERLGAAPERWGKPLAALLGAMHAQMQLGRAAIGGKDSMSGSYVDLDVPPTLISFAVAPAKASQVTSPEFMAANRRVIYMTPEPDSDGLPDFSTLLEQYKAVHDAICGGKVYSAFTLGAGGIAECVKMCFGNEIGLKITAQTDLFAPHFGGLVLEVDDSFSLPGFEELGKTLEKPVVEVDGGEIPLCDIIAAWQRPLEKIFPTEREENPVYYSDYNQRTTRRPAQKFAKPRVFIPVFPGTNCEYDSAIAFEKYGAECEVFVVKNINPADIEKSVEGLARGINSAQIVMLPGGFSAGDEPDGSGKFIATALRSPRVAEAVMRLLKERDGLMLGVCNGFQALIKVGLVPYGEIVEATVNDPTLTYNTIGRHVSAMVETRVSSVLSPWMMYHNVGDRHMIPISHGEGRFVAPQEVIDRLAASGQIATQYLGVNPNGTMNAIEGITSPDGRVFGKMAHSERVLDPNTAKNIPGDKVQNIFKAGVDYFKV